MAAGDLAITLAPFYAIEDDLETGRLECVLPEYQPPLFGLHAPCPPSRHMTRRIRALIDHLNASF